MYVLTISILTFFLLVSCADKQSFKLIKRPAILDDKAIVKFNSAKKAEQVTHFLAAHKTHETAGMCQRMLTAEGSISNWCIITQKGAAKLIVGYIQDKFGEGYRVSNLKYKGKNKFYNMDSNQYIYLTPYISTN